MTDDEKNAHDIRDKQLMRPKVLILLPFRSAAKKVIEEIIRQMTPPSGKMEVAFRKRFEKEFGSDPEVEKMKKNKTRPDEFKRIFGGNSDETFRIGMSFSPKAIRLYSPFYSSDIIIASPIGLRTIIRTEGEKQEYDFLSSIEMLIVEHADYILMQNPDYLKHVAEHLNLQPKQAHDCDFSRVRLWAAEGKSKYYRQNILLSHTPNLWFTAFMQRYGQNLNGMVEMKTDENAKAIALKNVPLPIPQMFHLVRGKTPSEVTGSKLKVFEKYFSKLKIFEI